MIRSSLESYISLNIFIGMKKQSYYLPNLSVLLAQKRRYQQHKQRLITSKSTLESPSNNYQTNRQNSTIQHKIAQLSRVSLSQVSQKQPQPSPINSYKVNRYCPSPYEKRKKEEADLQNLRVCESILLRNSTINKDNQKRIQEYTSLKERIGKFQKDGSKIVFKFEKSLQKVQKRRQERQLQFSQRQHAFDEKIKANLWHLLRQPQKDSKRSKTTIPQRDPKQSNQNDIFYNDGSSIRLKSQTDNHKHKTTLTPYQKKMRSEREMNEQQRDILSLHQSIKLSKPRKKFSQSFKYKILQKSKIQTSEIPKNPQSTRRQRVKPQKSDFHIIQMLPVSKTQQQ